MARTIALTARAGPCHERDNRNPDKDQENSDFIGIQPKGADPVAGVTSGNN